MSRRYIVQQTFPPTYSQCDFFLHNIKPNVNSLREVTFCVCPEKSDLILDSESLSVQKGLLDYYLTQRFPLLTLAYLGQKGSLDYHLLSLVLFDTEIPSVNIGIFGGKRSVGQSSTVTGII